MRCHILGGPFWARTQSKSRFFLIIYLGQTTGLVNWFLLDNEVIFAISTRVLVFAIVVLNYLTG